MRRKWRVSKIGYSGNAFTVTVSNSAGYASFVENGHRQTPGRYVKKIGKRLVASWVPGQFPMKKGVQAGMPAANRIVQTGVDQAVAKIFGGD
jgi:hypothetical protein